MTSSHKSTRSAKRAASAAPPARTAAIYARFSCSKQREASIDDQLRICREWCEREGYAIVAEYCDFAVSGRTDDRPQFQEMISNAGESEIVLVYMMDRFSRDVYDAPIYKKRLRGKGVRVVSATEALPDGPEAILIENIYEAMAAMESAHTSCRVYRGMEGNALKCMHNGATVYGYDFGDDGHYVINEAEAEIVRECFARKAAGENVGSISSDLVRRGVKTSKGAAATYGFVYNMLKNEKYTGTYIWGDVRVEGGMPAIVSREEFEIAQAAVPKKQRKSESWGEYRLVGRAVCGGCGHYLIGCSGRGRGGRKYEYYRCGDRCGMKSVRTDWLDAAIVAAIRTLLSDRDEAMRVARIVEAHSVDEGLERKAERALQKRQRAEEGIARVMDAIAEGIDAKLAKEKIEQLRAQASAAGHELAMCREARRFDTEDFADFLQFGAGLDDDAILKAFVCQVMVGEEDVIVTLNYDVKEFEPARLKISRVRTDSSWWTGRGSNPGPWD